jgi:aryl-alcohol dehydrogenase-like predicted oxidoreductase
MFMTDANWARIEQLEAFCTQHSRSLLELAFSWLAAQPVVACIIAGATKPEQLEANIKAADWQLTPDELQQINAITSPTKNHGD